MTTQVKEQPVQTTHKLRIFNGTRKVMSWQPGDLKAIAEVKQEFETKLADGGNGYDATTNQPVEEFSPDTDLLVVMPLAGG